MIQIMVTFYKVHALFASSIGASTFIIFKEGRLTCRTWTKYTSKMMFPGLLQLSFSSNFVNNQSFISTKVGGGSGTCAKGIMDYIMLNAPMRVYDNMSYTSSLAKKQLETVGQVHSHLSKFKVECLDAAGHSGWGQEIKSFPLKMGDVEPPPCWVIILEVLDNLPRDLIYSENQVSPWMEVWVEKQQDK